MYFSIVYYLLVSRPCFVTCSEMAYAKQFKSVINRTFSSVGGVLWETVSDAQLCQFMMGAVDAFFAQPCEEQKRLRAALTVGKQPDDNIYVFGDVQVKLNYSCIHSFGI